MSKHWTDEEWKEIMKAQGQALKSRLGDSDERRTEVRGVEEKGDDEAISKG